MSNLHGTDYLIKFKQGTRSNLLKTATSNAGVQGEPHYTTDTKQLFIHDGTVVQPIQTLDMAVVDMSDGSIVTDMSDGGVVFTF